MKKKFDVNKIPNFIIFILLIAFAPLGTLLFYKKTVAQKKNIYSKSKILIWMGLFVILLLSVGIYSKIKEIIELCSSGMSLDMIDLIPDNIWIYFVGIVMCISYFIGSKKINIQSKIERQYIKIINVDKETSLKKISKKLVVDVDELKEHLISLQNCEYLIPFEIDDNKKKIIYKDVKKENKRVQCSKCGALIYLKKEEYVECDFCGHGLIEENNL